MTAAQDYESIARILTLRYDPLQRPVRRPLEYGDFRPRIASKYEDKIIKIARNELLQKRKDLKFKCISMSLSGGIDSGITLAMLRSILPDVKITCISAGFGDKEDEVEQAKEISRMADCKFHGIFIDNVLSDLPRLINIVKEPRWNLYHYYPAEYGKRESNVFYSGDGGDELFGGYIFRYQKFLSHLKDDMGWKEKANLYLSCHERDWVPDQIDIFGRNLKFSWEKIYLLFKKYFDNSLAPLDQVFLADFNGKLLYDWLPTNIAFAKALELHIESIFLTTKMISFATHVPWQLKYDPKTQAGKLLLRSILKKQKGFENIDAAKKGFAMDVVSLWNRNAREIVYKYVNSESEVIRSRIISVDWLKKVEKKLHEGSLELDTRYINKMLLILALEIWYRLFVSRTLKHTKKL